MKICHWDWFNKKLKGKQLGRIFTAERILGRRAVMPGIQSKQHELYKVKVTMLHKSVDEKIWVNLSYNN